MTDGKMRMIKCGYRWKNGDEKIRKQRKLKKSNKIMMHDEREIHFRRSLKKKTVYLVREKSSFFSSFTSDPNGEDFH